MLVFLVQKSSPSNLAPNTTVVLISCLVQPFLSYTWNFFRNCDKAGVQWIRNGSVGYRVYIAYLKNVHAVSSCCFLKSSVLNSMETSSWNLKMRSPYIQKLGQGGKPIGHEPELAHPGL